VCVHVECSRILGVVDRLFSMGSMDAYVVQEGGVKEAYHNTALTPISSDSQ
jgi:ribosomal 30S subunit maturation factor RimM